MKVIDSGLVFDAGAAPPDQRACFFTTMLRLSSGKILVGFRRGSTKYSADGNCCVAQSSDDGRSWDMICERFDGRFDGTTGEVRSVSLAEAGDGAVLASLSTADRSKGDEYYSADSDTICPSRILATRSLDGGRTWSGNTLLDVGPWQFPVLSGPAVPVGNGRWLVTHERQEPETDGGPSLHGAAATLVGDDGRAEKVVPVARDPQDRLFYYDQRQAWCPNTNRLIAAFWTYDRDAERDVDIHLSVGSADGRRWSVPRGTGLQGQVAAPIALPDGRLLLFHVRRTPPLGLRLVASAGEGAGAEGGGRWDLAEELEVYAPARPGHARPNAAAGGDGGSGYAQLWQDMAVWSYGHPSAVLVEDGVLLLAYYAGQDERTLGVRWARVAV